MPDTFYIPMPRSPATELADDIDHLEASIPVLNTDVFPDPPNLATIGAGMVSRQTIDDGTTSTGGADTLEDDTKAWEIDSLVGYVLRIISGTGSGQRRLILSNTADTITVTAPWNVEPDNTSDYDIVTVLASPVSETILYTGKAVGALTGVTRSYEPEFSSRAWDGGTPIARVMTAQDLRALQNRVIAAELDIGTLQGDSLNHGISIVSLEADRDTLMLWYRNLRIWGAV